MNIVLQDTTFRQLRDFIYEKSGIYVPDMKKYLLENRLLKRVQENNLNSFEDYLYRIRYNNCGDELARLYDAITTNETFFFREQQQFDIFTEVVIPEVLKYKGTKGLQIWSAACSTGEEPYTITLLLREKRADVRAEIFASDISDGVLMSARKAVYGSYSVRNVPEPYLKKYFKANGQSYELEPSIRNSVKFMNINLTDEKRLPSMRNLDIIFCRNVLIYFDDKAKQKVISLLYDSLRPGGFLFIGASESLHNLTRAFKPTIINKVIVYQRI
ncbi:MAG TPA: protein-glutamate O-methyltransferase CheR [Thermodesulfovibrionales bacterium]|jgi:chemotaxis protein methyltransferase CheR|nr:protein-glutamate O-methyltransferase CheR [Thermodesulfovibrionales bacterium]